MARVSLGENEALAVIFRRYARPVRGIACKVLRDPGEADDLLQDIFLLVHRVASRFDPNKGTVRTWILQMAYRRAISRRRTLTAGRFYDRLDFDEDGDIERRSGQGSVTAGHESRAMLDRLIGQDALRKCLSELSDNQRETLQLFFFEGYTLAEIAEKLGQTTGNVSHHYYRALEKLRRRVFSDKLADK
jgi:RNA polymerase sigma-70 factor (ECF subfamily)